MFLYLNEYAPSLPKGNTKPYMPRRDIPLPPCDSKTTQYVIAFFAAAALIALPFGGLPLHLFQLPTAIDLAVLGSIICIAVKYVSSGLSDVKKAQRLKPAIIRPPNEGLEIEKLTFEAFEYFLSTYPRSDKEFFEKISPPGMKRDLNPIAYDLDGTLIEEKDLPQAYDKEFESTVLAIEKSSVSHLDFKEPDVGRIGFINGMDNSYSATYRTALYLSYLSGGYNVHITHNATHGLLKDAQECWLGDNGIVTAPAWHLLHMWDDFFKAHPDDGGGVFLQICHSQGAIHVANALQYYPEKYRKRIRVVAIAPGTYIHPNLAEAYHYISLDPVPYLNEKKQSEAKNVFYCEPDSLYNHGLRSPIYFRPLKERLLDLVTPLTQP